MGDFDDLLEANAAYAASFDHDDLEGRARAGVCVVTCMDSRIDPLAMLGLSIGDAKVLRNPGGRVTELTLEAIILAVNLLNCSRVMVVEHTKCAVASNSEEELQRRVTEAVGHDASHQHFPTVDDQHARLRADVEAIRGNVLVPPNVIAGGFVYDVDTGALTQVT
jgi:carbonic anhydrase